MAAEAGGIALLSMYNDEEEDDEEQEPEAHAGAGGRADADADADGGSKNNGISPPSYPAIESSSPSLGARSPFFPDEGADYKTLKSPVARSPTPPPFRLFQQSSPFPLTSPSPPPPVPPPTSFSDPVGAQRMRRGSLVIVDYAHDENALSPEPEEGEILSSGRVVMGAELQVSNGNLEERTPPGTVHILTPNTQQEPPQSSDLPEQSKNEISVAMEFSVAEPEVAPVEEAAADSMETQKDDPLNKFLPPPVTTKCTEELQLFQEKINKFLAYKRAGKSFNADLRNRKDYRNPDFLQHAVRYQDIDQIGTCLSKDVFDPHGYDKSDYYDEIEADMKREVERKEQERKKSQKVEFVAGGTQPGTVAPALKMSMQIPGVSAAATGVVQPVPKAVDAITKDIRQSKKTKWDKIDGDVKNPMHTGGHDNLSTVGVHAAHLSTANAGAGYTAFAQQKRREAEEKRSSERKFDKRS
ncbi:uncharacterized protein LOC103706867 isoform X2 [Phoenix dactylifera]|uniref:Uncharacterized protein LOC103706867 isoform X2 n=1 Tax=Phoenix dactylifera TaxID=42345 RepID=A0A8B7C0T3_PHODC|nr:uncharacterized protein LOC103706867 isoform X2 [Phoenix dactylifera]